MVAPAEWFAVLLALTLWVATVAFIAWLVVRSTNRSAPSRPVPAVQILEEREERYARGELGREEFLQAKQDLI